MTDGYEAIYRAMLGSAGSAGAAGSGSGDERPVGRGRRRAGRRTSAAEAGDVGRVGPGDVGARFLS